MRVCPEDGRIRIVNRSLEETLRSVGLLVLRVGAGVYMATHGWSKVRMALAGEFDKFGDPLGLGNTVALLGAAGAEFGCALLVAAGLATRWAALPVVFTMAVAAFVVHGADPWTMSGGASKEPALLYLIAFLAVALCGGGRFSADALLGPKLPERMRFLVR